MEKKLLFNALLDKYRTNGLSEEEFQQFIDLLDKSGQEKKDALDASFKMDWDPSRNFLDQITKEEKRKARRFAYRRWGWSSAAAVALLLVAWFLWPNHVPENLIYQTDYGETKTIELPDGSKVLLNANSQLTWKADWKKSLNRQAILKGEAFFDVTKVDNSLFEVLASGLNIKVLGTEFNVRNRDMDAEVFLHEGKVELEVDSDAFNKIVMDPGDFVHYDKSDRAVTIERDNRIEKKAAWVDGMLEFENKKVSLILIEFQDLYGKNFKIENPELANKRMDFSLPYADWRLVRKALEIAIGAEFIEARDNIIVK